MGTNFSIPEFFYDLIAILFPGIFVMILSYSIHPDALGNLVILYPHFNNIFILLFIAYIFGHIIYSLGSELVAPFFNFLSGNPIKTLLGHQIKKRQQLFNKYFLRENIAHDKYFSKNIIKGIEKYTSIDNFNLNEGENIDIAYEFCRNFIIEKASKNYTSIRKEQAYGELSRSMIFVSLSAIFIVVIYQISYGALEYFWLKLVCLFILLISFTFRYGQARHTSPIFIFSTFCTFLEVSTDNAEKTQNKKLKNKKHDKRKN